MTSTETVSAFQRPESTPQTLSQLLVLFFKEAARLLVRRIPLTIGLFLLATLLHTYLMAGPNGGFGRELTLLSDLLATQGKYGMEGTAANTLGATLIWTVLSALAVYTYYRIRTVGFDEYIEGFKRGISWTQDSLQGLGAMSLPAALIGASIALGIVGLFKNNGIGLILCAPLIAALGEQLESLWFLTLRLAWSDLQGTAKRLFKSERPFDPATACVGTLGAAIGFLLGYVLPGVRLSRTPPFAAAAILVLVAAILMFFGRRGRKPPPGLVLLAVLGFAFIALPVLAHDKGVVEEGGWINWLRQPGVLDAIARGLPPATAASMGLPIGVSLSTLASHLAKLPPEQRVKIYQDITRARPELLYPESLKVPHSKPSKKVGQAPTLGQVLGPGGGGGGPGKGPPAVPPVATRDRVYSGKDARKMLEGLGITTAQQTKDKKAPVPEDLEDLLGNRNKKRKPYDHVLHDYKDAQDKVVSQDIRPIQRIKGIAFERTKDGQIDLDSVTIIVEEDESPTTQPPKPKPKPKPKPQPKPKTDAKDKGKPAPKPKADAKDKVKPAPKPKTDAQDKGKPAPKPKTDAQDKGKPAPKPKADDKGKPTPKPKTDAKDKGKPAPKPKTDDAGDKGKPKPKPKPKRPSITQVLQDRIRDAVENADPSGVGQLTLRERDFTGMIPDKVLLPADLGSVKKPTVSFDSKEGTLAVSTEEFVAGVPLMRHAPGPIGDFFTERGKARVVARPFVQNGRLALDIREATTPALSKENANRVARKAADTALAPINKMLSDRGAELADVKVVDGGIRLVVKAKP